MNKQYFEKLNTEKLAEFNKQNELEKVEFAILDDLQNTVIAANKIMETADKVMEAASNVNSAINKVADDAKYYNKYKEITTQDLKGFEKELERQLKKAEQSAKDLGVDLKLASPNYERGKLGLKDIKDVLQMLNKTNLEFEV